MNPNDIIDAYHELHRLADICGTGTVTELWSRVRAEQALQRPTGPIGTVTSIRNDEAGLTVDVELNKEGREVVDRMESQPPVFTPVFTPVGITLDTDNGPVDLGSTVLEQEPQRITGDGCPWCAADVRPRQLWRHVNSAHRSDLEETYAEDGTKGLMETFGIGYQTAYGWGQRLEGDAA